VHGLESAHELGVHITINFMKNADDEDHKDAYLYFITEYFNSSKIKIRGTKIELI